MKSRRTFFKTALLGTSILAISGKDVFASVTPLQTLKIVQLDLFPQSMIENANAYAYLSLILNHSLVSEDDKKFLRNGTRWLNEEALKEYKTTYIKLNKHQRQNILKIISKETWGKSWIKKVLTYIMEATLGDPIYGINKNETGWRWLNHETGLPRPKAALL